jgi:hypothetical protein
LADGDAKADPQGLNIAQHLADSDAMVSHRNERLRQDKMLQGTMTGSWRSAKSLAIAGIAAQLLALIRTLSEFFRVKYFAPDRYALPGMEQFIGAALFTAVFVAVAVAAFALGRYRTALMIAVANVVTLFVYKVAFM